MIVKVSPGNSFPLLSIPVASTYLPFFVFLGLHKDVLAHPNKYASYAPHWLYFAVTASPTCSSVQTFAVWLPSVHGSPQTTLPLANTSDTTPRIRDFHPLGKCTLAVLFL